MGVCVGVYACPHARAHTCVYVCLQVHMCVHIHMYVPCMMRVCVHMCVCGGGGGCFCNQGFILLDQQE